MEARGKYSEPSKRSFRKFVENSKPPLLRSMRQFAEDEIVIPNGPHEGRRFRCDRQPYTIHWFDQVDSGQWTRLVATGPSQSGKTLSCFVIPLLYHLFEWRETVICAVPIIEMAGDKWLEDIKPVIERTRYRDLIPSQGKGSKGGSPGSIKFHNGATLRFMSGGGGDKSKAGFTSRVVVITETDGMDVASAKSRESDPISQLEARTNAYGSQKRIYMECTVSVPKGRTWKEYNSSTASRIMTPCPHCGKWVLLDRDDLHGWKGTESIIQARESSCFACNQCGEIWTEDQRKQANLDSLLVHDGQEISKGKVSGPIPPTDTLGFRWSAVNNMFVTDSDVGGDEWRAARSTDEDDAEKRMCQFVWALPFAEDEHEEDQIEANMISKRSVVGLPKGLVPDGYQYVTAGIDVGKYLLYWSMIAWKKDSTGHIVEYGRHEVPTDQVGLERALEISLAELMDILDETASVDRCLIDASYMPNEVCKAVKERGRDRVYYPMMGRGQSQQETTGNYNAPRSKAGKVLFIGHEYYIVKDVARGVKMVMANSDHWKSFLHRRLMVPVGSPMGMTVHEATAAELLSFSKHLTAEREERQFIAGKGYRSVWVQIRRQNHWLDSTYMGCLAGRMAGVRPDGKVVIPRKQEPGKQKSIHDYLMETV